MNDHEVLYSKHLNDLKRIKVEGGELAYIDKGEGSVILLVHGIPTSSWLYRDVIEILVEKGHRVIAPDMLGFGASDKPEDVEVYSPVREGERLLQLMSKLEIKEWYQVAHDAGGIWTWEMMRHDYSGLKGLVILNTILFEEGFKPPMKFERGPIGEAYAKTYCSPLLSGVMVRSTMNNGLYRKKLSEEVMHGYLFPIKRGNHSALYYFFTSFKEMYRKLPLYQESIENSGLPIRVIWGERDKVLRTEQIDFMKKRFGIPDEEIFLLKDEDHYIQEEDPERLAFLIHNFVNKIEV